MDGWVITLCYITQLTLVRSFADGTDSKLLPWVNLPLLTLPSAPLTAPHRRVDVDSRAFGSNDAWERGVKQI